MSSGSASPCQQGSGWLDPNPWDVRFVLLPVGTFGDLKPFLEVGTALQARGHEVLLASAEPFREVVQARGLPFASILSRTDHERCLAQPDLWHARKFFSTFTRGFLLPATAAILELVQKLPHPEEVRLVAAYSGSAGARMAAELFGCRHFSMWVDPAALRSSLAPPRISGLGFLPSRPSWLWRLVFWAIDRHADYWLARPLNRIRQNWGLSPIHSVLQWMVSRQRSVCLFPDWYCPAQSDWPVGAETVGFPLVAGGPLPQDVEDFLQQGTAPILITFGTGMNFAKDEFEQALQACQQLGERALLVAPAQAQLPHPLPAGSAVFCHRPPFESLFPRCRALISHGGIGTTAQALAAGIPQLAIPLAHDHPDNAARLERLGVGLGLSRTALSSQQMAQALGRLLAPQVQQRCRELADRVAQEDGLEKACQALERP